jgi:predicted O-methyltransferase YrrM
VTTDAGSGAEEYVRDLFRVLLRREPSDDELREWTTRMGAGMPEREVFSRFAGSAEYRSAHRIVPGFPAGHYYSPVVDPDELLAAQRPSRNIAPEEIAGIELSLARMTDWWRRNADTIRSTPFPEAESPAYRYYAANTMYPLGDAAVLRAMILEQRPQRIVEIGSGFSSACMLDTIDEAGLQTELTFIEPDAGRLRSLLRPADAGRARIIEAQVQDVQLDEFEALGEGDVLFIDSSHVLKTGSDVHRELFEILPTLAPGVLVHFHDIDYPFEYPDLFLFERRYSWNEAYAVRAFLMYNADYRVEFMTAMFRRLATDLVHETFPPFDEKPGASLWVRKAGR